MPMTLKQWIDAEMPSASKADVAERIGISRRYLLEILDGTKQPGRETIRKIDAATAGRVPASVWFSSQGAAA
jgi:transcriptional regulator with XRE-family HTH domain